MTAHRCAGGLKKKLNLRSGSQRHRHLVGFFNVPIQAPTRDPPFYSYSEKPPHFSRLLRHAWGYGGHILDLTPGSPRGGHHRDQTNISWPNLWHMIALDEKIMPFAWKVKVTIDICWIEQKCFSLHCPCNTCVLHINQKGNKLCAYCVYPCTVHVTFSTQYSA